MPPFGVISKAKPRGKQCQMCIHIREPFPGAARLALQVSDPKLWVAEQWQQLATGRILCAGVAGVYLQQGGDIFGLSGAKVRPKAHLFIERQKPKPLASQLLSSGCLRHPQSQLGGGASSSHSPTHNVIPLRDPLKDPERGSEMAQTCWFHPDRQTPITQLSRAVPFALSANPAILPSTHLSTTGILRGRKEEPASQGAYTGSFHFVGNSGLQFLFILIQINPKSAFLIPFCQKFQKKVIKLQSCRTKKMFAVINFNQKSEIELCLFISILITKASAHPTVLVIGHDSSSS